ncbi:hypothetical protein HNQ60_005299 [Povalibacter uvarum]|uniref:Methyltransferase type 12 domain-containing protein n=1 Tax=Povalibacter uvarum TaxID=732238 RepID=A0A841HSS6_9GAMM|nr:class I SAM-dependent methyltransferase [Povalibacter uvarum]MBB6096377.1 hypothetical protein [Povalibacter uvarum]
MSAASYASSDGIKAYTRLGLHLYDPLIVGVLARYVWDCPAEAFIDHYRQHVTGNHADIGVGTGYCLDRCGFDTPEPRIGLIDLQPNCLEFTANRLARYRPQVYLRDACRPLVGIDPFDSIALGGILHCLPGDMAQKCRVFDSLRPICRSGARIFGFTLVNDAIPDRTARRLAYRGLNGLRVINCMSDTAEELRQSLAARYVEHTVELIGCFAFFSARATTH